MLTRHEKIRYMWPTDMSTVKMLFFLVRYYPFVHTSLALWRKSPLLSFSPHPVLGPIFRDANIAASKTTGIWPR